MIVTAGTVTCYLIVSYTSTTGLVSSDVRQYLRKSESRLIGLAMGGSYGLSSWD